MESNFNKPDTKIDFEIAHDKYFNKLREEQYQRLSNEGHVYLDYTGGNIYSTHQINLHNQMLNKHIFGNPHSSNPTSELSTKLVEEARQKVLDFFNADDYYCIFTQNTTGALQIIGECYPFGPQSHFLLFADNHNSVNGIREYCKNKQGGYTYVPIQYKDLHVDSHSLKKYLNAFNHLENKLFAYPAQSNVSGVKHDLGWIDHALEKGWDVLLDAAAFVPTTKLDLTLVKPDFVTISFYKIFGYPTGIGCLLVKKSKFNKLTKPWFAGGTVTLVAIKSPHHYLADNHERFENGTINYLDIPSLKIGLDYIEKIGINKINERVSSLINYLYINLSKLKHDSGINQVKVFGPKDRKNTGGTLIMNFFNPDDSLINFETFEQKANSKKISIRSGCFCNPGIDEINNCLTNDELSSYFTSRNKGDYKDMISVLKKMRGAVRVSVGLPTTKADCDFFIEFVKGFKNQIV